MVYWQLDLFRSPVVSETGEPLWWLLACPPDRQWQEAIACPQPQLNSQWVSQQLQKWIQQHDEPDMLHVFRPQTFDLLAAASQPLDLSIIPTRYTPALKAWLRERSADYPAQPGYTNEPFNPLDIDPPPPQPVPDAMQAESWQFATLPFGDIGAIFERLIPIKRGIERLPDCALGESTMIPVVMMYGGRRSLPLARWLADEMPAAIHYIPGDPDGLVLEASLANRWIVATFGDRDVVQAARQFSHRQHAAQGWHLLMVCPDTSGVVTTGAWWLHQPDQL